MIYLSDDYLNKYCDALSYLLGRSYQEGYSFDYIEKTIAYSSPINELEKSDVTSIAFSSMEAIYNTVFPSHENTYKFDPYDNFGWIGYTYMHLFLSLEITFEALFYIVPLKEMMGLYHIYHEMDYNQTLDFVKDLKRNSVLDVIMRRKDYSCKTLSDVTGVPVSTINALRYGYRDIGKLEVDKLYLLSQKLHIKMETLLPSLHLDKQKNN